MSSVRGLSGKGKSLGEESSPLKMPKRFAGEKYRQEGAEEEMQEGGLGVGSR